MKVVIYARVSSLGDRQSTERQVRDLTDYATINGYTVDGVYEEHISGAKRNRPILTKCLDYCVSNNIDILLISELSRLGRNVDEVLANIRLAKSNHLNIYFQKENISIYDREDKENPYLTIMIAVLGTCAQLERENITYRLQSGRRNYIYNGGKVGRKVGSTKSREKKEQEYAKVLRSLRLGKSIRDTAKICSVGISTVQRLKREFAIIK